MQSWKPTRSEMLFAFLCLIAWSIVFHFIPPSFGSTDVYLFRDPACNFLAGKGFSTASYEHSHSFEPVLFSIYTPGSLWIFMLFAKFLGCGVTIAKIYPLLWSLPADLAVFAVGLRFIERKSHRWFFLILWAAILPVGTIISASERPEPVSFLVLLLLLLALRRRPTAGTAVVAGLLGGAAALSQPFAGILAFFLIGGWLFHGLFYSANQSRPSKKGIDTTHLKSSPVNAFATILLAGAFLALPVAVTAISFYRVDHQSLQRFLWQAKYGSLERSASYSSSETGPNKGAVAPATAKVGSLQKYKDAVKVHKSLGALHLFTYLSTAIMIGGWLYCLLTATDSIIGRCLLFIVGFACFLVPIIVFPLQYNYLVLTCALFPILLGFNWAGVRASLRTSDVIPVLLIGNILCVLPMLTVRVIQLGESRLSYKYSLQQADTLREYLDQHPLGHKVVLVPPTQYLLYKDAAKDIYNPSYLSDRQDPNDVGGVVNCYESTRNFTPGTLPLPDFVSKQRWKEISAARDPLTVTLLHHKIMSRNWSMECDIYVRDDD